MIKLLQGGFGTVLLVMLLLAHCTVRRLKTAPTRRGHIENSKKVDKLRALQKNMNSKGKALIQYQIDSINRIKNPYKENQY